MRLDDDLAAWADAVRLPAAEADAIFRRVTETPVVAAPAAAGPEVTRPVTAGATPTGLAPSWWREFNAGLAGRMIDSTRPAQSRATQQRAARGQAARRQAPPWPPAQRRAA